MVGLTVILGLYLIYRNINAFGMKIMKKIYVNRMRINWIFYRLSILAKIDQEDYLNVYEKQVKMHQVASNVSSVYLS